VPIHRRLNFYTRIGYNKEYKVKALSDPLPPHYIS
jgi:hypothetical protein